MWRSGTEFGPILGRRTHRRKAPLGGSAHSVPARGAPS